MMCWLEEDAITMYKEHIKAIADRKIKRLLKRILSDEESHHGDFPILWIRQRRKVPKTCEVTTRTKVTQILNWGIEHE